MRLALRYQGGGNYKVMNSSKAGLGFPLVLSTQPGAEETGTKVELEEQPRR